MMNSHAPEADKRSSSRRSPPESFLNTLDRQRYEFLAAKLAEFGLHDYARLAQRWARGGRPDRDGTGVDPAKR
jgi:hypothetical protein